MATLSTMVQIPTKELHLSVCTIPGLSKGLWWWWFLPKWKGNRWAICLHLGQGSRWILGGGQSRIPTCCCYMLCVAEKESSYLPQSYLLTNAFCTPRPGRSRSILGVIVLLAFCFGEDLEFGRKGINRQRDLETTDCIIQKMNGIALANLKIPSLIILPLEF